MDPPLAAQDGGEIAHLRFVEMIRRRAGDNPRSKLENLFQEMDANSDGMIILDEFARALSALEGVTQSDIAVLFDKYDTDSSNDISWDEFIAAVEADVSRPLTDEEQSRAAAGTRISSFLKKAATPVPSPVATPKDVDFVDERPVTADFGVEGGPSGVTAGPSVLYDVDIDDKAVGNTTQDKGTDTATAPPAGFLAEPNPEATQTLHVPAAESAVASAMSSAISSAGSSEISDLSDFDEEDEDDVNAQTNNVINAPPPRPPSEGGYGTDTNMTLQTQVEQDGDMAPQFIAQPPTRGFVDPKGMGEGRDPRRITIVGVASFIEMIAATYVCDTRSGLDLDCDERFGFAVALGVLSLVVVVAYIVYLYKIPNKITNGQGQVVGIEGDEKVTKMVALFLAIWWVMGIIVCTFREPFAFAGNGYYATWVAAIESVYFCSTAVPSLGRLFKMANDLEGSDVLLSIILFMSVVVMATAADQCEVLGECKKEVAFAVSVGTISTIIVLLCLLVKKLRPFHNYLSIGMSFLWFVGAWVLTFDAPFNQIGNGFFATWVAFFATTYWAIKFLTTSTGSLADVNQKLSFLEPTPPPGPPPMLNNSAQQ